MLELSYFFTNKTQTVEDHKLFNDGVGGLSCGIGNKMASQRMET